MQCPMQPPGSRIRCTWPVKRFSVIGIQEQQIRCLRPRKMPANRVHQELRSILIHGKTVMIGGLIKRSSGQTRESVPVIGKVPGLGRLFSNKSLSSVNSELVVLITPYIIGEDDDVALAGDTAAKIEQIRQELEFEPRDIEAVMRKERYIEVPLHEASSLSSD